jgi:hypothetical protein
MRRVIRRRLDGCRFLRQTGSGSDVKSLLPANPPHANSTGLNPRDEFALQRAVAILEGKSFVARMTEITGEPSRS